jgi:hypothetical protein
MKQFFLPFHRETEKSIKRRELGNFILSIKEKIYQKKRGGTDGERDMRK